MAKILYASPVLPNKAEFIRILYSNNRTNALSECDGEVAEFMEDLGVSRWQGWLQKFHQNHLFIQEIDVEDSKTFFEDFFEEIRSLNPIAEWLRNFYLEAFGRDYTDPSAKPNVEQLLSFEIPYFGDTDVIDCTSYALPLPENRLGTFREFCRQLNGEGRGQLQKYCYANRFVKLMHSVQRIGSQNFILFYTERLSELANASEENFEENDQWYRSQLIASTGLDKSALEPEIELACGDLLSAAVALR